MQTKKFKHQGYAMFDLIDKIHDLGLPQMWSITDYVDKVMTSKPKKSLRQELFIMKKRNFSE